MHNLRSLSCMGLVGMLVTVAIMVLGTGYLLWGAHPGHITVSNQTIPAAMENADEAAPAEADTVSGAQALIGQAKDPKATLESQATETSQQVTADSEQGAGNKEQGTVKTKIVPTIIDKKVSFGFSVSSGRKIDTVVLHSSYDAAGNDPYSVSGVIEEWRQAGVAPHYLIDRKGNIYRIVDDKNIAYHAGVSKMSDGRTDVNDFSIGIEMLNTKDDQFTNAQYAAVNSLVAYLKGQYPIKNVVGHDDIAPGRKTDPWNFDWKRMK